MTAVRVLDSILVYLGLGLILAGLVSLVRPMPFLHIRTRLLAVMLTAAGVFLEFIAGDMLDSFVVYLGLILFLAGLVSLIWPLRFLEIRTRPMAAMVTAGGLLFFVTALALPVSENAVTTPTAKLDDWMPHWQIRERHIIPVAAPPEKVFAAIHAVRADEIFLFRTLIAIRQCGQTGGPESIMNPPEQKPILDVATQTTFILLSEEPPRELVVGTVVAAPPKARASGRLTPELFQKKLQPGVALATMNFLVTPDEQGGSTISTETRIYANNESALRRFVVYWRIIHPGSDIIRRMWLRAIKQRAEG